MLLNRRGYATSLLCRECGQRGDVPELLRLAHAPPHRRGTRSATTAATRRRRPTACAACHGAYLRAPGFGTEQVAEAVAAAFPTARVERLDRDRASRRGVLGRRSPPSSRARSTSWWARR